jgi:hypothetical protein
MYPKEKKEVRRETNKNRNKERGGVNRRRRNEGVK